jgi:hypothetical protein
MSTKLQEVAKKKTAILEKILQYDNKSSIVSHSRRHSSSSGPETRVIANIQEKINNPLFELSIADYELMCDNKMVSKMIAKVLECDEKQLKKFCKYINVFKENINSSPKSIKNKMKPKNSLNKLPDDLRYKIVEHYTKLFPTKYVLRSWIPINKLNGYGLSSNPNAVNFLEENLNMINWRELSSNPNAIELLRANPDKIDWVFLSKNPDLKAIEMLKANPDKISWGYLAQNSNPEAIKLIEEKIKVNPEIIPFDNLAANETPEAIKLIFLFNRLNKNTLYQVSNSMRFWSILSRNSKAVKILKANPRNIHWDQLCSNKSTEAIQLLEEQMTNKWVDPVKIDKNISWLNLSSNPNQRAFEILEANPTKIDYRGLSANSNPNAIELLKKRMEVQNEYKRKEDRIDWKTLSKNPGAIELIKNKKIYEDELSDSKSLEDTEKIDWRILSSNPAIFEAK